MFMERLNKYLAGAGLGSRRYCDDLIEQGRVQIGDEVVRDLGRRVQLGDDVQVDGRPVVPKQRHVYWLVNKPMGYISSNHDPGQRPRVVDLVVHVPERTFMVGRLDEASEGLMLLTNDGELAYRLMHPRYGVEKTYLVQVVGKPSRETLQSLRDGVWISEGKVHAKRIKRLKVKGQSTYLEMVLDEGKNREIRRMLAKLGHKVMNLKRVAIGPVYLGRLKKGKARKLRPDELAQLRKVAGLT
jgi:23S rRNA pseudouridine2605 synthase